MNPDNYKYYEGLQKCVGLHSKIGQYSSDEIDQLDTLYKSLAQQFTWSSAVKRIPLDFLEGVKFHDAADNYVRPLLTKGVPSLFSDLSPLYDHPGNSRTGLNCYYIDSLKHSTINQQLKQIIDAFCREMLVYTTQSGSDKRINLMWKQVRVPKQSGNTECGYYVCKFMKEMIMDLICWSMQILAMGSRFIKMFI